MRLIDVTQIPDHQYMDFVRWFSMMNPETTWNVVFLDRLKKEGGQIKVGALMKKLLVDPDGWELLAFYRNSLVCPVEDGMTRATFVASYSLESRYKAERGLAPDTVLVLTNPRVDEEGQRWLSREDVRLSSLPLEPAPPVTEANIQWSKEEVARREIEKETARIKTKWQLAQKEG